MSLIRANSNNNRQINIIAQDLVPKLLEHTADPVVLNLVLNLSEKNLSLEQLRTLASFYDLVISKYQSTSTTQKLYRELLDVCVERLAANNGVDLVELYDAIRHINFDSLLLQPSNALFNNIIIQLKQSRVVLPVELLKEIAGWLTPFVPFNGRVRNESTIESDIPHYYVTKLEPKSLSKSIFKPVSDTKNISFFPAAAAAKPVVTAACFQSTLTDDASMFLTNVPAATTAKPVVTAECFQPAFLTDDSETLTLSGPG